MIIQDNDFEVLEKEKNHTPFLGMLICLYKIRFVDKNLLDKENSTNAIKCLNIIAEDDCYNDDTRCFCYNQLGLIHSGQSSFVDVNIFD